MVGSPTYGVLSWVLDSLWSHADIMDLMPEESVALLPHDAAVDYSEGAIGVSVLGQELVGVVGGVKYIGWVDVVVTAISQAQANLEIVGPISVIIRRIFENMQETADPDRGEYGTITSCTWEGETFLMYEDKESKIWPHMGHVFRVFIQ